MCLKHFIIYTVDGMYSLCAVYTACSNIKFNSTGWYLYMLIHILYFKLM